MTIVREKIAEQLQIALARLANETSKQGDEQIDASARNCQRFPIITTDESTTRRSFLSTSMSDTHRLTVGMIRVGHQFDRDSRTNLSADQHNYPTLFWLSNANE